MKIILASQSERRKNILKENGYEFEIMVSTYEKNIVGQNYSDGLLYSCVDGKYLSIEKDILEKIGNEEYKIIVADTVVVLNNIIIGKPKDREDAIRILSALSGKTHYVATGIEVISIKNKVILKNFGIDKSFVTFKNLDLNKIEKYVDEKKPFDKAGSYGIQDEGFDFVEKIDGNRDNVVGLSMNLLKKLFE